jgi:hypothetical protein
MRFGTPAAVCVVVASGVTQRVVVASGVKQGFCGCGSNTALPKTQCGFRQPHTHLAHPLAR